jgi:CHAD domain-containing protein
MNPILKSNCRKDPSYCKFGAQKLFVLLNSFEAQIEGVIKNEDLEYVHKMRVSSRRLRAAMPLFESCFPKKEFKKWLKEIKKVTRLLAEARDLDVQIAFIKEYLKKTRSSEEIGLTLLLKHYNDRRESAQLIVVSGLRRLKASNVLPNMKMFCATILEELAQIPFDLSSVQERVCCLMFSKVDEFLALQGYVHQASENHKHHEMRIRAKRLRYTLEVFSSFYKNELAEEIATIKNFQDILGEMHDSLIWIENIPNFLSKAKVNFVSKNKIQKFEEIEQQLQNFLDYLKSNGQHYYNEFVALWEVNVAKNFFGRLKETASAVLSLTEHKLDANPSNTSVKFENKELDIDSITDDGQIPKDTIPNSAEMVEISKKVSKKYFVDTGHFEQVRKLSLKCFDELQSLHRLGKRERCWLECAAILHDIGLSEGTRNHHKKTLDLILNDMELPFTLSEKRIIGSIARYHRKGLPKERHYNLAAFSQGTIEKIMVLSSLLRVADGLDNTHQSIVKDLTFKKDSKEITAQCLSDSNHIFEQQEFNKKKELFEKVFKVKLVSTWSHQ